MLLGQTTQNKTHKDRALAKGQKADAGFTARAFIPTGHYVTSSITSRPFMDRFYFYSELVTLKAFPECPSMQLEVPEEEPLQEPLQEEPKRNTIINH